MNTYEISQLPAGHRITLNPTKVSLFIKVVLGVLTVLTITAPMLILFSENPSPGAVIGAIVSVLCFLLLFRLFLWNAFGAEVFEIEKHQVWHYTDYKYFKDELFKSEDTNAISLSYVNAGLDQNDLSTEYLLALFEQNKEASLGNVKLKLEQIEKILQELKGN